MNRVLAHPRARLSALLLTAALAGGCATVERPDPLESMNRKVYAFNESVDKYVLAPPARAYRDNVPSTVRLGVSNFFNNLRDAWSAVNQLLQGKPTGAAHDLMRFMTNTVFGFGGVLDWASEMGLDPHYEDFGQTLGVWGVGPGAYIVWPVLGSSTVRDSAGLPVDILASPETFVNSTAGANGLRVLRVVNTRADLLGASGLLDDIAIDKYAFVRDAYLQRRLSQIYDGNPPEAESERYDLPEAPPAGASAPVQ